jgi:molecular chaperone GrpE
MSSKKQKAKEQQEKQQKAAEAQDGHNQENQQTQEEEKAEAGLGVSAEEEARQSGGEAEKTEDRVEELQRRIKELELENSELKAQYLRKQADFENFRKRMQKEKQESTKYANKDLLQDLISVIDDFERAIKSAEESKDFDSFHSGIQLIERQLVSMLESKYGLKRMESEGKEFDPQKHEAIAMVESPDHEVQTVVEDYQKGYMIHDRVLRHAKVRVAVPAQSSEKGEENNGQDSASGEQQKAESDNGS